MRQWVLAIFFAICGSSAASAQYCEVLRSCLQMKSRELSFRCDGGQRQWRNDVKALQGPNCPSDFTMRYRDDAEGGEWEVMKRSSWFQSCGPVKSMRLSSLCKRPEKDTTRRKKSSGGGSPTAFSLAATMRSCSNGECQTFQMTLRSDGETLSGVSDGNPSSYKIGGQVLDGKSGQTGTSTWRMETDDTVIRTPTGLRMNSKWTYTMRDKGVVTSVSSSVAQSELCIGDGGCEISGRQTINENFKGKASVRHVTLSSTTCKIK